MTVREGHPWPLWVGLLLLGVLWLGPLPAMSRTAFSAHMILHVGVVALVAPLLALGLVRSRYYLEPKAHARVWIFAAFAVEMVVVWGWHMPSLHEAAARNVGLFVVQQLSFLAVGLSIWMLGLSAKAKGTIAVAALGFLMTLMHMTMLGVLLIFAPRLLYSPDVCLGAFGFEQLEDQRFGGVLMAAVSGIAYLWGGLLLGTRLLAHHDAQDEPALDEGRM